MINIMFNKYICFYKLGVNFLSVQKKTKFVFLAQRRVLGPGRVLRHPGRHCGQSPTRALPPHGPRGQAQGEAGGGRRQGAQYELYSHECVQFWILDDQSYWPRKDCGQLLPKTWNFADEGQ